MPSKDITSRILKMKPPKTVDRLKERTKALKGLKALQSVERAMRADPRFPDWWRNRLTYELGLLADTIDGALPLEDPATKARLVSFFDGE